MQRRLKLASYLFLSISVTGLLCQSAFSRQKTARTGQKFMAAGSPAVAGKPALQSEVGKVILVLQTRDHLVTVRGRGEEQSRYSVATLQGIALAEDLSVNDLKNRFPDLHEIVTGIAWAGM